MSRLLLFGLLVVLIACRREPDLLVYGSIPDFILIDSDARPFSGVALRNKVWIANFIFTSCAGTCPAMSAKMRKLQDGLPAEIHLVSFTVDPARDTPQVLAAYAKQYAAEPSRWHFVTGEKAALYKLSIEGFKLAVDDTMGAEVEPITHSTRFVLVDRMGQIRGFYSGMEEQDLSRLAADARTLL